MYSASKPEFDIEKFKSVMEEAPSPENGRNFEYEGIIDKSFKGFFPYKSLISLTF